MKKYNLSKIMKRAWELVKTVGMTISSALIKSWEMKPDGTYDFSKKIGIYSGNAGAEGDLVVYLPVVGQVYGYGQKDYRGNHTIKSCCKWTGNEFVTCDKLGNIKEAL